VTRLVLPQKPRILVIALRRLGDVLLTTPLIRSLRRAWPEARIEALVFSDTTGILAGNPDLNGVETMPAKASAMQGLALASRLWRRYDLAISTQTGDRPSFFAYVAGRTRVGLTENGSRLKQRAFQRSVASATGIHRVEQLLRLADLIEIPRVAEVIAPRPADAGVSGSYAVIHASPMFRYKQWSAAGWRELAAALAARGLQVIASGGPSEAERRYLDEIWAGARVTRIDGTLNWPQLTGLLAKARVYVGPDTSVTHLAAAAGCPTVALYGPTDPRLWGPWPAGGLNAPWEASGAVQQRGNVFLVQNPLPCMPCQLEGCERRLESHSACLDELPPARVIAAAEQAIAWPRADKATS
jgi:heptosyltransferase-3